MLKEEEALVSRKLGSLTNTTNLSKVVVLLVIVAFSCYLWKLERSS